MLYLQQLKRIRPPLHWIRGSHESLSARSHLRSIRSLSRSILSNRVARWAAQTPAEVTSRLCAKDRKHYSAKSKPVQLLCDDFMHKVNTATVTEQDMTVAQFWEKEIGRSLRMASIGVLCRTAKSRSGSAISSCLFRKPICGHPAVQEEVAGAGRREDSV